MKAFIAYNDDNGDKVSGYFDLLEINQSYIKILSVENIVYIPFNRVIKVKHSLKDEAVKA